MTGSTWEAGVTQAVDSVYFLRKESVMHRGSLEEEVQIPSCWLKGKSCWSGSSLNSFPWEHPAEFFTYITWKHNIKQKYQYLKKTLNVFIIDLHWEKHLKEENSRLGIDHLLMNFFLFLQTSKKSKTGCRKCTSYSVVLQNPKQMKWQYAWAMLSQRKPGKCASNTNFIFRSQIG